MTSMVKQINIGMKMECQRCLTKTFRLLLTIFFLVGSTYSEVDETPLEVVLATSDEYQFDGIPLDGHFSAKPLPPELSHSCTCDRMTACGHGHDHDRSSCGARIFYLVGIHNNRTLEDAVYLFRGIRDPRNTILIHIDLKFDLKFYENSTLKQEIDACPCGSHVEVASVHNASWSSWSMNKPTLWAMEKAVKRYSGKWDVFVNLSGDTLPVYTPDRIAKLFGGPLAGINFITSSSCETGLTPTPITAFPKKWHKRSHYSYQPAILDYVDDDGTHHTNVTLMTYFGSQWMTLQPEWCEFLINQLERPDSLASRFRDHLIKTRKLMTDETFIPTLIMHLFPETTPKVYEDFSFVSDEVEMYAIRYERMDEHYPSSTGWFPTDQRYEVPESSGVEKPRPWGPYFLGVYDLDNIRQVGALYIRKVSTAIDHNLFRLLPVDDPEQIPAISWPKEVKISPVPNWEKKLAELNEKHNEENALKGHDQAESIENKVSDKEPAQRADETLKDKEDWRTSNELEFKKQK